MMQAALVGIPMQRMEVVRKQDWCLRPIALGLEELPRRMELRSTGYLVLETLLRATLFCRAHQEPALSEAHQVIVRHQEQQAKPLAGRPNCISLRMYPVTPFCHCLNEL
jgi:hypothetical protein